MLHSTEPIQRAKIHKGSTLTLNGTETLKSINGNPCVDPNFLAKMTTLKEVYCPEP